MSTKRASEEAPHPDGKKMKQETAEENVTVNFQYYSPSSIFPTINSTDENHKGMTGKENTALATMFYHSRYTDEGQIRHTNRANLLDRNAGAVQLYKNDGVTPFTIPGYENEEYYFVSYGNKYFKEYTKPDSGVKRSSYGHSERMLMKRVLDDLMRANEDSGYPSDPNNFDSNFKSLEENEQDYKILKRLTENTSQYKEYLTEKKIIVKMWSERPACEKPPVSGVGGDCKTFIRNICPEGSQFGWIVKDYEQSKDNQDGAPKVKSASEEFKKAYLQYIKDF